MDTTRGPKEIARFASPVARAGQNEGELWNRVQKEEVINKINKREEKGGAEGESFLASSQKEFETGEVLECSEKSEIGKGNRSTGVESKQPKILKKKNLSAKEMKGGKSTNAGRKRTIKCVVSDESMVAEDKEWWAVQGDGGSWDEWGEQGGDAGKLREEKNPVLSGGAKSSTSEGKKSNKKKKKGLGVEVQAENEMKENKCETVKAEEKGGNEERPRGNSVDSKQRASQGAMTGKPRVQSVIKSKDPQPISSLLSDSQYSEIFQSVLDTSLEQCLEDARAVLCEVELLQASIGTSCESAIGGNTEGELESSQSGRGSRVTGQKQKRKLQEKSVEKTNGKQTKECELEPKKSNCNEDEYDLWAQCSRNSCKKWRRLECHEDLSVLPADWVCSQNKDPKHNNCDCPEEDWSYNEEHMVLSSLVPGSMVWAQQLGFPWWPAMIEPDPDTKSSFLFKNMQDEDPCKYHVTYFCEPVTRAWVPACRVKAFHALSEEAATRMVSQESLKKMFSVSLNMSRQAERLPLKRRLAKFGFLSRYKDSKKSGEDDDAESSGEYSCDEQDFGGTCKKRFKKGAKPETKKKELGKKEKGREEEKKKAVNTLFSVLKEKKAPRKPESAGEADSCSKEAEAGGEPAEKKVFTPSFTKPKGKKTGEKQALQAEKPPPKIREQTVPGITAPRGQESGEGVRGKGSTGEDRKAGKIKGTEEGLKKNVEKEEGGEERKSEIPREVKREDRKESNTEGGIKKESEGEELEEESVGKMEKSVAAEDPTGFLEDDMKILNCQPEYLKDGETSEEEEDEEV